MILAFLALASAQQVQLNPAQDLTLQPGATLTGTVGNGNRGNANCDDFNRANGPMSGFWTNMSGTQLIENNAGKGMPGQGNAWMMSTNSNCPAGVSKVSIEYPPNNNGGLTYIAAVTGIGASQNYFTKIQSQSGGPTYDTFGFYVGFNGGGSGVYGGFFAFPVPVQAGRMDVRYDQATDSMILDIDEGNNGTIEYSFAAANASTVGGLGGPGHGIGTYGDQVYDNWQINDGCGGSSPVVLTKTGTCPGFMTIRITGATPNSPVPVFYGPAGSYTKPNGTCAGVVLNISGPTLATVLTSNGQGKAGFQLNFPGQLCGRTVQVVDIATCQASNSITL